MPNKHVLQPYHAIVAGNMSGNLTSPVTNIQFLDNCLIQLNFTGTPTGNFAVQVSSDYAVGSDGKTVQNAGTWVSLPLSPSPSATGSANQIIIDLNEIPAPWIRVVYTASSGAGTLDMWISAKTI